MSVLSAGCPTEHGHVEIQDERAGGLLAPNKAARSDPIHLTLDSEAPPSHGSIELNGTQKMPTAVSKHLALDEDDPPSYDSTDENDENDEADWALDQAAES